MQDLLARLAEQLLNLYQPLNTVFVWEHVP